MAQSLFRSEDMKFVQLTMTEATAHSTLMAIGGLGCLHLNDLGALHAEGGSNVHEAYMHYKKRVANCFYWEKKLQGVRQAMADNGITPPAADHMEHEIADGAAPPDVLHACASWLEPIEEQLTQNIFFQKQQTQKINEQTERSYVLEKCKNLSYVRRGGAGGGDDKAMDPKEFELTQMSQQRTAVGTGDKKESDLEAGSGGARGSKFTANICGVISVDRQAFFERMLFRVSRGNALVTFMPIEDKIFDPNTNEEVSKSVFTIVFVGEQVKNRILKICGFVGATIVPVPTDAMSYDMELKLIGQRLEEYSGVLTRTKDDIYKILSSVAFVDGKSGPEAVSPIVQWEKLLSREKAVCDALRKCDWPRGSDVVYAEGYIPVDDADKLSAVVEEIRKKSPECVCDIAPLEKWHSPPTYFRTNKYTDPFQTIVNTYGFPRYKEANPGLFTIFTFPFLFGVMYGDIGHGSLLTLFSLYLIWKEEDFERAIARKELGEIFPMAFGGRYLLVGMGICAIYCGIMYNDCFSIPWNVYGSVWEFPYWEDVTTPGFREANKIGTVYPIGVDPAWYGAVNELTFFNSMKMKLSVTMGVTHMTFGLFLQLSNHLYNHDMLGVFCEFLPQLLFMTCTFGYMVLLIIIKLSTNWTEPGHISPPNLIQTMIGMFLNVGTVDPSKQLYEGQAGLQTALVLIALFSVPVMLFARPCYENHMNKILKERAGGITMGDDHGDSGAGAHDSEEPAPQPLSDDGGASDEKHPQHHQPHKLSPIDEKGGPVADLGADAAKQHGGGGGGGGHGHGGEETTFGDLLIHQTIHTIEFVLGAVSNTASYLRLWALSLAHSELSTVFWDKMLMQYGVYTMNPVMVVIGFAIWATATVAVLMSMDVLECFLHALRLHWVEFQNKFFHADGYAFQPFDFKPKAESG